MCMSVCHSLSSCLYVCVCAHTSKCEVYLILIKKWFAIYNQLKSFHRLSLCLASVGRRNKAISSTVQRGELANQWALCGRALTETRQTHFMARGGDGLLSGVDDKKWAFTATEFGYLRLDANHKKSSYETHALQTAMWCSNCQFTASIKYKSVQTACRHVWDCKTCMFSCANISLDI